MNKKHFMSIFIASIMILSVLGVAIQYTTGNSESIKIGNQKFKQYQGGWLAYKDDKQILIPTQPDLLQFQQIPEISFSNLNSAGKIYFSSNPNNQIPQQALFSIQNNLFPYLNNVVVACIEDSETCVNLPLKTCGDADIGIVVIQAEISNTTITSFDNNCLLIQGPSYSITQRVDALVLKLHGII
ncbi:hypothetical protein HYT56_01340 [Candidatus Woesearchaeota archaeon]|nr:hypothetical protein [Candidatus Woesearchaeota archaeon]